jgi:hypothetical protein
VRFYPLTNLASLSSLGYLGGMEAFLRSYQDAVPERYRLLSPVSRVDSWAPPTFLVHGGDDRIVRVLGSVVRVVTCTAAKYQYRSQFASCSTVLSARGVRVQGGYRTHCKRASTYMRISWRWLPLYPLEFSSLFRQLPLRTIQSAAPRLRHDSQVILHAPLVWLHLVSCT